MSRNLSSVELRMLWQGPRYKRQIKRERERKKEKKNGVLNNECLNIDEVGREHSDQRRTTFNHGCNTKLLVDPEETESDSGPGPGVRGPGAQDKGNFHCLLYINSLDIWRQKDGATPDQKGVYLSPYCTSLLLTRLLAVWLSGWSLVSASSLFLLPLPGSPAFPSLALLLAVQLFIRPIRQSHINVALMETKESHER
ncbi:hypothetical protein STEG23_003120, partial [Scotinomys teguina]